MPAEPANDVLAAFGQAIRRLRVERGLSQEALAEAASIHPRYLSDVERGRRNIAMVNVDRLASALGVDLATLMAEVDAARR